MTRYQLHVQKWHKGCGHQACQTACRVCLFRGVVPCEVLFLGEAPGPSENVLAEPFIGPAGQLLDSIWHRAKDGAGRTGVRMDVTAGFGNLVGCIPLDEDGVKFTEPPDDQVRACSARLQELVALCDPQVIVAVGKTAKEWIEPGYKHRIKFHREVPQVDIVHPAAILRAPIAQKSMMVQRSVVTLKSMLEGLRCRR